jgi:hypothetical protein
MTKGCCIEEKITADIRKILLHHKKRCNLVDFNEVREKIIDKESKISKLIQSSSTDHFRNLINNWQKDMMN